MTFRRLFDDFSTTLDDFPTTAELIPIDMAKRTPTTADLIPIMTAKRTPMTAEFIPIVAAKRMPTTANGQLHDGDGNFDVVGGVGKREPREGGCGAVEPYGV